MVRFLSAEFFSAYDQIIENIITEEVIRGKDVDIDRIRESLIYHIDDNLGAFRQGR